MKLYPFAALAALTVLLIVSAGCVTSQQQPDPLGTSWTLSSFGSSGDAPHGIISISFHDTLASGSTGINTYRGYYVAAPSSGALSFSQLSMTKMSGSETLTADETRYIAALTNTTAYTLTKDTLTLMDASGQTLLTFGIPLTDTSWRLVSYTAPGADYETSTLGMITASFSKDGTMTGNDGINTYSALWSINQSSLVLGSPSVTKVLGPQTLVDQEQTYLSLLGSVSGFSFSSGHLLLTNGAGETILTFAPVLASTTWTLTEINGSTLPDAAPEITLVFGNDGTFSGHSSVNLYFGDWYQTGTSSILVDNMGTTLLMGSADLQATEQTYLAVLTAVTAFDVGETELTLTTPGGGSLLFTENYAETLKGTSWSLMDNDQVTLFIVDNAASINGVAQVNSYGADLTLTSTGGFSLRNFYSSQMYGTPALQAAENAYFQTLQAVASCEVSSAQLILYNGFGNRVLVFNPGI